MTEENIITFDHVSKEFTRADSKEKLQVLKNINLEIHKGSIFGIIGYSGAGKSTLIRCINGIELPDAGKVNFEDIEINHMPKKQLRETRKEMGMIFQQFNLMPSRTVFENVALPIKYSKQSQQQIKDKVLELLKIVGLPDKADAFPSTLSGGQKQRVAIARALVNDPKVLLCDEATSALDPQTTEDIIQLLKRLNRQLDITIVVVTHEMQVIEELCDDVAVLDKGKIVEQGDVYSVFVDPKTPLTKKFIATTSKLNLPDEVLNSNLLKLHDNDLLVKVTYISSKAIEPLISAISRKFNVDANIIVGDIKILRGKPLGGLVIILSGKQSDVSGALSYIKEKQVRTEVLASA